MEEAHSCTAALFHGTKRQYAFDPAWLVSIPHHAFGNIVDFHKPMSPQDIGCPRRTHAGGAYRRHGTRPVAINRFKHRIDEGGHSFAGKADADRPVRQTAGPPFAIGSHVDDEEGITVHQGPGAVGRQGPVSGAAQRQEENENGKGRAGCNADPALAMALRVTSTMESAATHRTLEDQDTDSV